MRVHLLNRTARVPITATMGAKDHTAPEPGLAQRALALLFLAGTVFGALSVLLPHGARVHDDALWVNTALGGVAAVVLLALPRVPRWFLRVALSAGILVITSAVWYGGGADSFYVVWYVWAAAYAFSFFPRRAAAAQMALIAVAYAVVLVHEPGSAPLPRWMTTVTTLAITGVFLDALARRVRAQAARLEELALTDPLTGLPNRRAWDEQLPRALATAARGGRPLCLAVVDLDHFKRFNDDHGHPGGDALLRAAAAAWADDLRAGDLLARYGGEEFGLLLPDCELADAEAIVDRLRAHTPDGQTCSIGLAVWDGRESAGALVAAADDALYLAKLQGRDRISARVAA